MPNLIHWTQRVLEGSKIVLFFKIFKKMKINQKFAKKAMIVASLTAGVIGFNSMFNEAQASGWCWGTYSERNGIPMCSGFASNCTHPCRGY